jgi:hypothetical protein
VMAAGGNAWMDAFNVAFRAGSVMGRGLDSSASQLHLSHD